MTIQTWKFLYSDYINAIGTQKNVQVKLVMQLRIFHEP